ncbi:MAG TPA: hypothetical protein VMI31_13925 [Fimbriimonadaceae bacterium]|nr:hypothetical protein [Fimbriimonadaceae bacterium]
MAGTFFFGIRETGVETRNMPFDPNVISEEALATSSLHGPFNARASSGSPTRSPVAKTEPAL